MRIKRYLWLGLIICCFLIFQGCFFQKNKTEQKSVTITISSASDLSLAFPKIAKLWGQDTGNQVSFNFGSSGQLAQQIERGARVDIFASADRSYVEDLEKKGLIKEETKLIYGTGRIVLWSRKDNPIQLNKIEDLLIPKIKKVSMANPEHAPYGKIAKEALERAGIWDKIQEKLIIAENIRQAQNYAETGNVDVAITALSLTVKQEGHRLSIPEHFYHPLEQMLAIPKSAIYPQEGWSFAQFVDSQKGKEILKEYGFS